MAEPETAAETETSTLPMVEPPVWPYVVPLAGFLALTAFEGYLPTGMGGAPSPTWYPIGYAIKMVVVTVLVGVCRVTLRDFRPLPTNLWLLLSVGVGLAVAAAWVGLDGRYPELPFLGGKRTAFDPTVLPPRLASPSLPSGSTAWCWWSR